MMKRLVYVGTTIPSYLTAWPSRDLVRAAHQQITQEWKNCVGKEPAMSEDSVLREVRTARENYARSHGFDVGRIVADLRKLDEAGDWKVVRLALPRPCLPRS